MGNLLNGATSESANVGARWPVRNIFADAQSLNPRPARNSDFWNGGMAKAPSARTGVSFSNSRRLMRLNLRLSVLVTRTLPVGEVPYILIGFMPSNKVTTFRTGKVAGSPSPQDCTVFGPVVTLRGGLLRKRGKPISTQCCSYNIDILGLGVIIRI